MKSGGVKTGAVNCDKEAELCRNVRTGQTGRPALRLVHGQVRATVTACLTSFAHPRWLTRCCRWLLHVGCGCGCGCGCGVAGGGGVRGADVRRGHVAQGALSLPPSLSLPIPRPSPCVNPALTFLPSPLASSVVAWQEVYEWVLDKAPSGVVNLRHAAQVPSFSSYPYALAPLCVFCPCALVPLCPCALVPLCPSALVPLCPCALAPMSTCVCPLRARRPLTSVARAFLFDPCFRRTSSWPSWGTRRRPRWGSDSCCSPPRSERERLREKHWLPSFTAHAPAPLNTPHLTPSV